MSFWQAFRNTFIISAYNLIFGFPIPIILALLLQKLEMSLQEKFAQTATYLPLLSEVTITGITLMLVYSGVRSSGIIASIFKNWA